MRQDLPALQLGRIAVDFPVVQAALSGYSDWPARVIARRLGAGYTISEVLLDQFVLHVSKGRKAKRFLRVSDEERPVGAQLMGSEAESFAAAALRLVEAGFDWIDVNFACPVKKVLSRCRGGYLLGHPQAALAILARLRDALPPQVPITVKLRQGMDGSQKSVDDFFAIVEGAFALGAAAITVHARTVQQGYGGRASWEFLKRVKQHVGDRVVLGSGDLFTAQDCLDMIATTGVNGASVARGAIGNPWIYRQARALAAGRPAVAPSLEEQREVIAEHYRLAEQVYGPKRTCTVMRKFGIKYARLHPHATQVRDAFVQVRRPGQWHEVLRDWYAGAI